MSTLFKHYDSFDLIFNDLLRGSGYRPFNEVKPNFPLDIYTTSEFLVFEIPLSGVDSENLEITKTNDELRISYKPINPDQEREYIHRGIARRSFEFAWRISPKFDLSQLSNTYSKGLLSIFIPWAKNALPERVPVLDLDKNREKVLNEKSLEDN